MRVCVCMHACVRGVLLQDMCTHSFYFVPIYSNYRCWLWYTYKCSYRIWKGTATVYIVLLTCDEHVLVGATDVLMQLYTLSVSINQSRMHVSSTGGHPWDYSYACPCENTWLVNNGYINLFKLSIHLILGLPLDSLPSITPTYTFWVVKSLFMSSNLHFLFSSIQDVFLPQSLPDLFTSHSV